MVEPLLQLRNIRIDRDGIEILDLPKLAIEQGEILAIIGPNGAGKSTLMMAISGLIPIKNGEIVFRDVVSNRTGSFPFAGDWHWSCKIRCCCI